MFAVGPVRMKMPHNTTEFDELVNPSRVRGGPAGHKEKRPERVAAKEGNSR